VGISSTLGLDLEPFLLQISETIDALERLVAADPDSEQFSRTRFA
jgi:hypothetical protein